MKSKLSGFQKVMVIFIPVIVLLLIAAVVLCVGFTFGAHNGRAILETGNLTIFMALGAALLAIAAIVFTILSAGKEKQNENDVDAAIEQAIQNVKN